MSTCRICGAYTPDGPDDCGADLGPCPECEPPLPRRPPPPVAVGPEEPPWWDAADEETPATPAVVAPASDRRGR